MEKEKIPVKITFVNDGHMAEVTLNNPDAENDELLAILGCFASMLIRRMTSQGMTFSEAVEEITLTVGAAVVIFSKEMPNQDFFV